MKAVVLLLFMSLLFSLNSISESQYLDYIFELTKELTDHKNAVGSVAFSSDGRFMASGSADKSVKLWEADSGKSIKAIMRHPSAIMCVSFSPDSNILAAGAEDGTITLWDLNYRERIRTLRGHRNRVWSVRFSPDGTILVSGSADGNIKFWDMGFGKEIRFIEGSAEALHSLYFSPDGEYLAGSFADGSIKVWSVESGAETLSLKEDSGSVNSVCFSHDGKAIASGARSGMVRIWDAASGKELMSFSGYKGTIGINDSIAFGRDNRTLVWGGSDGKIIVLELSSGKAIKELEAHESMINSIAFNREGRSMASASLDGVVKLWKIRVKESLEIALKADYSGWQRGSLEISADVVGLPDKLKFQYSLDGDEWFDIAEKAESPYTVVWNTASSITKATRGISLRAMVQNPAGITAMDVGDVKLSIDNEPPKTEHDYNGLWHKDDFQINLSADDSEGIGLSSTNYRVNYGEEKTTKWNGQPQITSEGINTLEYWSVDKLGNEESHQLLEGVKLDKTPPEFQSWSKEPESLMSDIKGSFRVSVRVIDTGGSELGDKVPQLDYHIGSDTNYEGYKDMSEADNGIWYYDIPEPPEGWSNYGGNTLYYKARCEDLAGNMARSAEQQELIGSPKVPPTVKMTSELKNWENGIIELQAEASDTDGIIQKVILEYSFDNVSWTLIGEGNESPYSMQWDTRSEIAEVKRTVWIRVTAVDDDGLSASYVSPMVSIDNKPPVTTHNYDGQWRKIDFKVNLKGDDGDGSGIASLNYILNDGSEKNVLIDGQPEINEQGENVLEYWSTDVAGNEEEHKLLPSIKLDRIAPLFGTWVAEQKDSVLNVEISVTDADSGLEDAPQLDYHIGLNTRYLGYRDMKKLEGNRWGYDIDISENMPEALGETVFLRVSAKDGVGNLSIKMWEHRITGEYEAPVDVIKEAETSKPETAEPESTLSIDSKWEEDMDIKSVPVEKTRKKSSSIIWTVQAPDELRASEEISMKGRLEPNLGKSVPIVLTFVAPDDTLISRIDTDPNGEFQFTMPLNSEGEWKITADWAGNSEYEPTRSVALTLQVAPETSTLSDSPRAVKAVKGTSGFIRRNTMIIGVLFLYIVLIRLYKG
jgi:WD40 repeat protein